LQDGVAMKKVIRMASLQTKSRSKMLLRSTTLRTVGTKKVSQGIGNMAKQKRKRKTAAIGLEEEETIGHKFSLVAEITAGVAATETA